jgi:PASTA domain/Bacterial Ig domain
VPQGGGQPAEVEEISLSWTESYDGQTGCWTLGSASGAASLSGTGSRPDGSDCTARINLAGDAAGNFLSDQMSSAGQYPYVTQTYPATGLRDPNYWFVEEYAPNFYGDPQGVLRTSDSDHDDWCHQPLNGYQPTNNTQFTGDDCHVGPYYAGGPVDFLTFPANGSNTRGDSCKYMSTDSRGDTITETLQQSMTLSSRTPICTDVSASTTENEPVTLQLACTNPSNSQLDYFFATRPSHAASWSFEGDRIIYTPTPGFTGTDTFNYFAEPVDGLRGNTATATITVTPPTGSPKPPTPPEKAHKHKHPKKHKRHKGERRGVACKVPKVKGRTLLGAKLSLRRAHCGVGRVTRRKSSTVAKGRVVASSPRAATRHRAGTKVKLTVSLGH